MTLMTDAEHLIDPDDPAGPARADGWGDRLVRPVRALRAVPHVGIYAGIVLVAAGAVLIFVAWVKTAALTNVALQIPYVVSAGFTGLALIGVGLTVVNINVKWEEARGRRRQTSELAALLAELRGNADADRGR